MQTICYAIRAQIVNSRLQLRDSYLRMSKYRLQENGLTLQLKRYWYCGRCKRICGRSSRAFGTIFTLFLRYCSSYSLMEHVCKLKGLAFVKLICFQGPATSIFNNKSDLAILQTNRWCIKRDTQREREGGAERRRALFAERNGEYFTYVRIQRHRFAGKIVWPEFEGKGAQTHIRTRIKRNIIWNWFT
jgi:hypothetical protein